MNSLAGDRGISSRFASPGASSNPFEPGESENAEPGGCGGIADVHGCSSRCAWPRCAWLQQQRPELSLLSWVCTVRFWWGLAQAGAGRRVRVQELGRKGSRTGEELNTAALSFPVLVGSHPGTRQGWGTGGLRSDFIAQYPDSTN